MKSNLQNGAAGNLSGNGPVGFYIKTLGAADQNARWSKYGTWGLGIQTQLRDPLNRHITSFGKYNKFDNGSDSHNFELVGRVVEPALWFYQIQ